MTNRFLILALMALSLAACTKEPTSKQTPNPDTNPDTILVDTTWLEDGDTIFF